MTRWRHPDKEIRKALDNADTTSVQITPKPGRHGHAWGFLRCLICGDYKSIWSTPRDPHLHARQLRQWLRRHRHEETR